MKPFITSIFALTLLLFITACSGSDEKPANNTTPLLQVAFNDIPYQTEQFHRVCYTLSTWEFEKDGLELQKIIVLNRDTNEELMTLEQADLPLIYKNPLPSVPHIVWDTFDRYYLSIQLPIPLEAPVPVAIKHRFVFRNTTTSATETVDGGVLSPRIQETPLVIASPLRGNNLMFLNQSTTGYHFEVLLFANGGIFTPERYAFDSVQLNDELTKQYKGLDPLNNSAYFNYGSTLYAVADGTVVNIQDGKPENRGASHDVVLGSLVDYAGNYITLDIGDGRYAHYAHCMPNNFTVHVGDRVKKGDPLGKLGNSGNSDAPHLHFQITNGPDFFFSMGVPFILENYIKIADVVAIDESLEQAITIRLPTPVHLKNTLMEQASVISIE